MGPSFGPTPAFAFQQLQILPPDQFAFLCHTLHNRNLQVLGTMKLGAGKPSVRAVLGASADGSYVSAVWPVARHYAIYRQSATAWEE